MFCKGSKDPLRPDGCCRCDSLSRFRHPAPLYSDSIALVSSKFPAHLSHLAETSFYVNSQTDPCKPSDKQCVLLQRQVANEGRGQRPFLLFDTSADLHLAFRIRPRMPGTALSQGRSREGGWTIVRMRGEGTTYDQIAFSHCCRALGTGINSSAHSEVGATPQMPSADEEVQTKEQRSLCKMPKPSAGFRPSPAPGSTGRHGH